MAKQVTSAEYYPPLPQELPGEAFASFEKLLKTRLSAALRQRINRTAYSLIDAISRHEARPNARQVLKRLNEVIKVLEQSFGRDPSILLKRLTWLLEKDDIGHVVRSLMPPQLEPNSNAALLFLEAISTIPHDDLTVRKKLLLDSARRLRSHQRRQYSRAGPEPASYRDVFIFDLAQIYRDIRGVEPVAYAVQRVQDHSLFVKFVRVVTREAVSCFAPKWNMSTPRKTLSPSSMSALAVKILRDPKKTRHIKPRPVTSHGGSGKLRAKRAR